MVNFKWHHPLDPDCPNYPLGEEFWNDPMTIYSGVGDEIADLLEDKHRKDCQRCRFFGASNIEVVEA